MSSRSNRRLVALFLGTVLLPCAVLLSIALHTMQREREFEAMRAVGDRARRLADVRQILFSRLETIKQRAIAAAGAKNRSSPMSATGDSTVRLVAEMRGGLLLLDWEVNKRTQPDSRVFETARRTGEIAEFSKRDAVAAARSYAAAISTAQTAEQVAEARLSRARVLLAAGRRTDAIAEYSRLLILPFAISDEHGVPFAAYAASRLLEPSAVAVMRQLESQSRSACCVSAEGWFMVRAIADSLLRGQPTRPGVDQRSVLQLRALANRRAEDAEQGAKLKSDPGALRIVSESAERESGAWFQYGAHPWFVSGAGSTSNGRDIVVGIDAIATLNAVNQVIANSFPPVVQLSLAMGPAHTSSGQMLAPEFPDVRASFRSLSGPAPLRSTPFYLGMLLLVVCVSLFGAYMVWYDVRRELRLSELRSHFVASVSHELKTPLTSIRMFAETLLLGRSKNREVESEYLSSIVNETERLTRLLNNVLDVSKIDRGEKIYRFSRTSLAQVVDRCARTMEYPLAQHGLHLNVSSDGSVPRLSADEDAVQQAVLNLLANAMKYSNGSKQVDLRLHRAGTEAVIEVRDRGIGIPPEYLAHVVEKFYRVPSAENMLIPGTGLGLTLVDHIVRAHGGRLEIVSEPGKGSTMSIHLPLEPLE